MTLFVVWRGPSPPPRRVTNWQESLGVAYNPRASAVGRSGSVGRSRSAPRLRPGEEGHDAWETTPGGDSVYYGDEYGDGGDFGGGGGDTGDIVFPPSPPDVHPGMKRRESNHIPIHSSISHYRHRDDGVKEVDRLEDARLEERAKTPGRIRGSGEGPAAHAAKFSKHVDYFERLHMERVQKARNEVGLY